MKIAYERSLNVAMAELKKAQRLLAQTISEYPTPISGCDAQFNHLLSDRARIAMTLSALNTQPFIPTSRQMEPDEEAPSSAA